jgi:hypothetical protein
MTRVQAIDAQKEIEAVLKKHQLHYKVEYVRQPDLKFINLEVSIKITN